MSRPNRPSFYQAAERFSFAHMKSFLVRNRTPIQSLYRSTRGNNDNSASNELLIRGWMIIVNIFPLVKENSRTSKDHAISDFEWRLGNIKGILGPTGTGGPTRGHATESPLQSLTAVRVTGRLTLVRSRLGAHDVAVALLVAEDRVKAPLRRLDAGRIPRRAPPAQRVNVAERQASANRRPCVTPQSGPHRQWGIQPASCHQSSESFPGLHLARVQA